MISFLFETCSFTNNPNFICFKYKLKKKHLLVKYLICETEIHWVEICPKASLLLLCRTHFFFSSWQCFYFPWYVHLFVFFPCYPATKGKVSKHVLLFSLTLRLLIVIPPPLTNFSKFFHPLNFQFFSIRDILKCEHSFHTKSILKETLAL